MFFIIIICYFELSFLPFKTNSKQQIKENTRCRHAAKENPTLGENPIKILPSVDSRWDDQDTYNLDSRLPFSSHPPFIVLAYQDL